MKDNCKITIKNIAVCFYGQYRTGDACLKAIKNFYKLSDDHNINVDFFCSFKSYETTYTRHKFNKQNNKDWTSKKIYKSFEVQKQIDYIQEVLQPKSIKVMDTNVEESLKDHEKSIIHSKVLNAWNHAINLKQVYEIENDLTYDMVFMQRYDAVIYPLYAFECIVKKFNNLETSTRNIFNSGDKCAFFSNTIDLIRNNFGLGFYPNSQDMWCFGIGPAIDMIVAEFLASMNSKDYSMLGFNNFTQGIPYYDTHEMLGTTCNKLSIPHFNYPKIGTDKSCTLPLENINYTPNVKFNAIAPLLIRDSFLSNIEKPLEEYSNQDLEKLYDYIVDQWHRGA